MGNHFVLRNELPLFLICQMIGECIVHQGREDVIQLELNVHLETYILSCCQRQSRINEDYITHPFILQICYCRGVIKYEIVIFDRCSHDRVFSWDFSA